MAATKVKKVNEINVHYAWKDAIPGFIEKDFESIGKLALPAGKWVVFAKLCLGRSPVRLPGAVQVVARLEMGPEFDQAETRLEAIQTDSELPDRSTVAMNVAHEFAAEGEAVVKVRRSDTTLPAGVFASDLKITAIETDAWSRHPIE